MQNNPHDILDLESQQQPNNQIADQQQEQQQDQASGIDLPTTSTRNQRKSRRTSVRGSTSNRGTESQNAEEEVDISGIAGPSAKTQSNPRSNLPSDPKGKGKKRAHSPSPPPSLHEQEQDPLESDSSLSELSQSGSEESELSELEDETKGKSKGKSKAKATTTAKGKGKAKATPTNVDKGKGKATSTSAAKPPPRKKLRFSTTAASEDPTASTATPSGSGSTLTRSLRSRSKPSTSTTPSASTSAAASRVRIAARRKMSSNSNTSTGSGSGSVGAGTGGNLGGGNEVTGSKGKGKAPARKSTRVSKKEKAASAASKVAGDSDDEMDICRDGEGDSLEAEEPAPKNTRKKSVGGKRTPVTRPITTARRASRRQAEPEPQDEGSEDEDMDDYEDIDDDDEPPVRRASSGLAGGLLAAAARAGAVAGAGRGQAAGSSVPAPRFGGGERSAQGVESFEALMSNLAASRGGVSGFYKAVNRMGGGPGSGMIAEPWASMMKNLKSSKAATRSSALDSATQTIAIAQPGELDYFPWTEAVKVFLGIVGGKPIVDKAEGEEEAAAGEDDFESMTEEQQLQWAMAMSTGQPMPKAGEDINPEQDIQSQLLACRCLQNLLMVAENQGYGNGGGYSVAHSIVSNNGVKVLTGKLTNIEHFEMAEQSVATLAQLAESLSRSRHKGGLLQDGGLKTMLDLFDFFDAFSQKKIVGAIGNCCRVLDAADFPRIREILPSLRQLIARSDAAIVEGTITGIIRMLGAYGNNTSIIEEILDRSMIDEFAKILLPGSGSPVIDTHLVTSILRSFTLSLKQSSAVTLNFFEANMPRTLYCMLTGVLPPDDQDIAEGAVEGPAEAVILQTLGARPKEQNEEILTLICELLPPLPKDGVFEVRNYSERMLGRYNKAKDKLSRQMAKGITPDSTLEEIVQAYRSSSAAQGEKKVASTSNVATPTDATPTTEAPNPLATAPITSVQQAAAQNKKKAEAVNQARLDMMKANPHHVNAFARIITPVLVDVYHVSAAVRVRSRILNALLRIAAFSEPDDLLDALTHVPLGHLLSSIFFSGNDANTGDISAMTNNQALVTNALQLAELLIMKLPNVYNQAFQREGVFYEVGKIAKGELSDAVKSKQKAAAKSKSKTDTENTSQSENAEGEGSAASGIIPAVPAAIPLAANPFPDDRAAGANAALQSLTRAFGGIPDPAMIRAMMEGGQDFGNLEHLFGPIGPAGASTASGRKVSSIPVDPRDANIVRARIFGIKRWSLLAGSRETPEISHSVDALYQRLSADSIAEEEIESVLREVATLLVDEESPLSSFEMQQSGLLGRLISLLQDGPKSFHRRRLLFDILSKTARQDGTTALLLLVKRLQEGLSRTDSFEVEMNGFDMDSRRPGTSLQRTLRFTVAVDEHSPMPFSMSPLAGVLPCIYTISKLHLHIREAPANERKTRAQVAGSGSSRFGDLGSARSIGSAGGDPAALLNSLLGNANATAATAATASATGASSSRRSSARLRGEPAVASESDAADETEHATREPGSQDEMMDGDDDDRSTEASQSGGDIHAMDAEFLHPDGLLEDDDDDMDDEVDDEGMYMGGHMDDEMDDDDEEHGSGAEQDRTAAVEVPADGGRPQAVTPQGTRVATPSLDVPANEASRVANGAKQAGVSYSTALKTPSNDWHYRFFYRGQELHDTETLYGAVIRARRLLATKERFNLYETVAFTVRKVKGPAPVQGCRPRDIQHADPASAEGIPDELTSDSVQAVALRMLRLVYSVNMDRRDKLGDTDPRVVQEAEFINGKLTAKFIRQFEELLLVGCDALPNWAETLPRSFRFLFPFDARFGCMQNTSFGLPRLLNKYNAVLTTRNGQNLERLHHMGNPFKVKLPREHLLPSARLAIRNFCSITPALEFQYIDEEGTGLGPTLEMYSMASKAFAQRSSRMWRDEDPHKPNVWVHHPNGLFPRPYLDLAAPAITASDENGLRPIFVDLGSFVGRALYDSRLIDFNFNKVFLKAVLGEIVDLSSETLKLVDPDLARTMAKLEEMLADRKRIEEDENIDASEKLDALKALSFDGAAIEDLSLDFTVPGYPDVPLIENGAAVNVTLDNLSSYIERVYDVTLKSGIEKSVAQFREGFSQIFPVSDLCIFSADELGLLFGNPEEDWTRETIETSIKTEHGYHADSKQVRFLVDLMVNYSVPERRGFTKFLTGSPKLPLGGFRALHPPLTIVRKMEPPPYKPDEYMPSVMTCVAYLKLPEYSTKEIMKAQLHRAMTDGGEGFLLS